MFKLKKKQKQKRRIPLEYKLNMFSVTFILLAVIGVMVISYFVQSNRVQEGYVNIANKAADDSTRFILPDMVDYLRQRIDSEEFAEVRQQAIDAKDETIIQEWMNTQRGALVEEEAFADYLEEAEGSSNIIQGSLYSDYLYLGSDLSHIYKNYDISDIYYEYIGEDGEMYYLAYPPKGGLLALGTKGVFFSTKSAIKRNGLVEAAIVRDGNELNCRAAKVITTVGQDDIVGLVIVDVNMDQIRKASFSFLYNTIIFAGVLTLVCVLLNLFFLNRVAIGPITQLKEGTCGFGQGEDGYTMDKVVKIDLKSDDEISDLYQEIRAMQTRIVNYTGELARLTEEKAKAKTEMTLAANIQQSMLHRDFPNHPRYEIYASMTPAKAVGGDFYDFFTIDDDHIALIIADVSGKGVPASLFMMETMLLVKARGMAGGTPSEIMEAVNNELCAHNDAGMFVTVWLGILNIETGMMKCSNAGHEYPILRGNDGVFRILKDKHGMVAGSMPGIKYTDYELQLEPGNILFVYTDGVPEADNKDQQFYGSDRLLHALNGEGIHSSEDVLNAVHQDVERFVDGNEQFDDLTMLCIKYKGQ